MVSGTLVGSLSASKSSGSSGSRSLLPVVFIAFSMASLAALATSSLVSYMRSQMMGTSSGSACDTCAGDDSENAASCESAASLVCHLDEPIASRSMGITAAQQPLRFEVSFLKALTADLPAERTSFCLSPSASSTVGYRPTMKGSPREPFSLHTASTTYMAAERAAGVFLSLAAAVSSLHRSA